MAATLAHEPGPSGGFMLLVDKPMGWTSFDVIHKIRRLFHVKKAGHAGTLDPLATGLLIVCTGPMTREIGRFMGAEKEYEVTMLLGSRTPSFDAETPVTETRPTGSLTETGVREALSGFVGPQRQIPPMWSAVKVGGKRLYRYAKRGIEVERSPREVTIHAITPVRIDIPEVTMSVVCSKGTYIRTLVDDCGQLLGCGAYVSSLRRTRIGPYRIEEASTIDDLVAIAQALDGGTLGAERTSSPARNLQEAGAPTE
jgi:tRNA pseudouridine55 synthase